MLAAGTQVTTAIERDDPFDLRQVLQQTACEFVELAADDQHARVGIREDELNLRPGEPGATSPVEDGLERCRQRTDFTGGGK